MALNKEQKEKVIEKLKKDLEKQKAIFFIDFQNLKSKELFSLRNKLKKIQAKLYVAKKSLINLTLKEKKIPVDVKNLTGQIGVIFAYDNELLPLKTVYNFWEKHKNPEILAGFWENKFLDKEKVLELAKLPSKQELQSKLVNCLNAPIYNLAETLGATIKGLIYVLANIKT